MTFKEDIFQFIKTEESNYDTQEVDILDNVRWNMKSHIHTSYRMKWGWWELSTNDLKTKKFFKKVILPILRLRYRAENVDVKDIVPYAEEPEYQHLSLVIKKYHDNVYIVENDIEGFLNKFKEGEVDLGGGLAEKGKNGMPKSVNLMTVAFCDQTDILGGPIAFKFNFSPDKLRAKAKQGWGKKENGATIDLENLIKLAKASKDAPQEVGSKENKTTGKSIEVYIVRGQMPETYLNPKSKGETLVNQVQVVAFYQDGKKHVGHILYRAKEVEEVFKFFNPEEIYNRALGMGGAEELFDTQIFTNFAEIHKVNFLKAASKIIPWVSDEAFANRNKIKDMENMEWAVLEKGAQMGIIQNGSPNIQLFNEAIREYELHARDIGGATDPLLGKQPPAGTPFRLQERVTFEGKQLPEYRITKYAKFIEEIYRDWIIPDITKKILQGKKFLATLSSDEMQFVMERITTNRAAKAQVEAVLNGEIPEDFEALKQRFRNEFLQGGNKQAMEILKDEFKDVHLKVKVSVAGKQKDLSMLTDKLVNILRQYLATPQIKQDPVALKLLNRIFEASGLSPVDFSTLAQLPVEGAASEATKPIQGLVKEPALT